MAPVKQSLVADCSVVVKWKLQQESQAQEAKELLLDWQAQAVQVHAPSLLSAEIMSALLRALRQRRVTEPDAIDAIRDLLAFPFVIWQMESSLVLKAFDIAKRFNQRSYDCIYAALAEQESVDLWTGDQRLFNALHQHFPLVRWIGDYKRKRP
jgi:predicted nucleic acid-binding protein